MMMPGRPKKQSEQRAEPGADHGPLAGAELLGAERRGHEVDAVAGDADDADDDERQHADARESVGPGGEQQPAEDQHRARQRRQHDADEADDDQHDASVQSSDGHDESSDQCR